MKNCCLLANFVSMQVSWSSKASFESTCFLQKVGAGPMPPNMTGSFKLLWQGNQGWLLTLGGVKVSPGSFNFQMSLGNLYTMQQEAYHLLSILNDTVSQVLFLEIGFTLFISLNFYFIKCKSYWWRMLPKAWVTWNQQFKKGGSWKRNSSKR